MKTGMFEEKEGVVSSTRVMTFIAAIAGIFVAVASVFVQDITLGDALPMVITLLSYSFGAKIFSKFAEVKK
jgi:hypothetical protein